MINNLKIFLLFLPLLILIISVSLGNLVLLGIAQIVIRIFPGLFDWLVFQSQIGYIKGSFILLYLILLGIISLSVGLFFMKWINSYLDTRQN
ncbi:MAG: hypothetical protein ABS939_00675 [Psychrobacillus sp.]